MGSLLDQANQAALAQVQAEKPNSFRVGGNWDGHKVSGGLSFDRAWRNGLGLTAYLRAWYNDAPVIPERKAGVELGFEAVKKL